MQRKFKQILLVSCPFFFLLVVFGGGLHLNPAGAYLAAATGTPLILHVFNRWSRGLGFQDAHFPSESSPSLRRSVKVGANDAYEFESKDIIRQ